MSKEALRSSTAWIHNTRLLVVSGSVPDDLAQLFLSYVLAGGRVLCLCSDLLHLVLPSFRTAEVRHNELVRFSYARWKNVPMMHHVFCYQASPVRTRFAPSSLAEGRSAGYVLFHEIIKGMGNKLVHRYYTVRQKKSQFFVPMFSW